MDDTQTVKLDLILRFESQTVTGRIRTGDGAEHAFAGWLGLLAALQGQGPPDRTISSAPAGLRAQTRHPATAGPPSE